MAGARTLGNEAIPKELWPRKGKGKDHVQTLAYLLEKGANVEMRDCAGNTGIHNACGLYANELTLKLAGMLIAKGADVNARNRCVFPMGR